jgi:hypothetical protein
VSNRLSYSQSRLFQECGKKYDFYYNQKLRERTKSAALFMGAAIDKAVEHALKFPEQDEKAVFDKAFSEGEINGKAINIPNSILIGYSNADMDFDLLTDDDFKFLSVKAKEYIDTSDVEFAYEECLAAKKQKKYKHFSTNQNKFLNLCAWTSLRRKGHLMLEANRKLIMPNIREVVGTQVKIELQNSNGDSLLGYADLVCYWKEETEPTVFDYKTSSIAYEEDAVLTSEQLTIYAHALNLKRAGYIVLRKGVKKNRIKKCRSCGYDGSSSRAKTCPNEYGGMRCAGEWAETIKPEIEVNILQDNVPERTDEVILENIEAISKAIDASVFIRNYSSCEQPWGRCAYYNKCWKNDDKDLEKVEK